MSRFRFLVSWTIGGFGILSIILPSYPVQALSGSQFDPARIIDDAVFTNRSSMSVSQIQTFLQSKVPQCDTNGSKPSPWGGTNASYGTSRGYPPPYVCLKSYRENPTIPTGSGEPWWDNGRTNLQGATVNPDGDLSAAQIIKRAADEYRISPKVILVILQKETSLVTDTVPWPSQYRKAMGYACPDTAACNPAYRGFYNQVTSAARQLRRYLDYPENYNHTVGNTFVRYHPNSSCGGTVVNIKTASTAALYNYTPYQPNKAALDNLYGTGNGCSAYGNRNFWRLYNDWFGSTFGVNVSFVRYDSSTDKSGDRALVGIQLSAKPTSNVTVPVQVSSKSNARTISSVSRVTITPETWNKPHRNVVAITGKSNNALVGTHPIWLRLLKPVSSDVRYASLGAEQIEDAALIHQDTLNPPNVYRLYLPQHNQHHFTASASERSSLSEEGWVDEGIKFSYCYGGEQTIARLVKNNMRRLVVDGSSTYKQALTEGFKLERLVFATSQQGTVPIYWHYNPTTGNSLYTTSSAEGLSGGFVDKGVAFYACEPDHVPVYQLYKPSSDKYFWTASPSERDRALNQIGFRKPKLGFYACKGGDIPVYRLYHTDRSNHLYTASKLERDKVIAAGSYRYNGVAFRLCPSGTRDVYRLQHLRQKNYLYTVSSSERSKAVASGGYRYGGVGFRTK